VSSAAPTTPQSTEPPCEDRGTLRWAIFEVLWIFLLFYLYAGSPPPDAGESHYLVKAKHYWNPDWCPGDLFLESQDAHLTYYWTFGWLTLLFSLEACAWIGRALAWLLLAWSWRRLSFAIVPRPLWSILSAALLLLLARNFNWAREQAIGGFEAKTIAYGLVFLALEAAVRQWWRRALLWAGAASAFHVLVGGWTVIALVLAWALTGRSRPSARSLLPALIGGLVLALPGIVPTLNLMRGVPSDMAAEAARIYVFDRLPHHLVFHTFGTWYYLRHGLVMLAWLVLAWQLWTHDPTRRLSLVVIGAATIALFGILIDLAGLLTMQLEGRSLVEYQLRVAPRLRLYWFRLEDALLPAATALGFIAWLGRLQAIQPLRANWLLVAAMLAAGLNMADLCYWRSQVRVPDSVIQQRPTFDSRPRWWLDEPRPISRMFRPLPGSDRLLTAQEWLAHWQDACRWVNRSTPADARFLTPRRQQTFTWYAGRAQVASWKDIPQDARSIAQWKHALDELYPNVDSHWREDLAAFTDDELVTLARKYDCQYIVIDRNRSSRRIDLPSVYPLYREVNPAFEVFRVPAEKVPRE
jgi:Domain of unknown function (DUF6798)